MISGKMGWIFNNKPNVIHDVPIGKKVEGDRTSSSFKKYKKKIEITTIFVVINRVVSIVSLFL